MVRYIDHSGDALDLVHDHDFNALLEGDIGHATALTSATKGNDGLAVINPDQTDDAAVRSHCRIHLALDDLCDGLFGGVCPQWVGVVKVGSSTIRLSLKSKVAPSM